jgi:hypothetical protein
MRKILGWIMVSLASLILFGAMVFFVGIWVALIVSGIALSFTFLVTKGITFIIES